MRGGWNGTIRGERNFLMDFLQESDDKESDRFLVWESSKGDFAKEGEDQTLICKKRKVKF